MKTRFALIASLCLLAGCSAQGPDNRTADLRGKRVLVFTGHGEGYVHENIAASAAMILELAAQEEARKKAEAREKLPDTVAALQKENEMLKQCLLEMSEIVYA